MNISINGEMLKQVTTCSYVGRIITYNVRGKIKIKIIGMVKNKFSNVKRILTSREKKPIR